MIGISSDFDDDDFSNSMFSEETPDTGDEYQQVESTSQDEMEIGESINVSFNIFLPAYDRVVSGADMNQESHTTPEKTSENDDDKNNTLPLPIISKDSEPSEEEKPKPRLKLSKKKKNENIKKKQEEKQSESSTETHNTFNPDYPYCELPPGKMDAGESFLWAIGSQYIFQ